MLPSELNTEINGIVAAHTDRLLPRPGSNSWADSIRGRDFSRALQMLDTVLSADDSDSAAAPGARENNTEKTMERLWWLRCQLELGQVPVSVLAAPLEESFEEYRKDLSLRPLLVITLLVLAQSAISRTQCRLACITVERAFDLLRTNPHFSVSDQRVIARMLGEIINQELKPVTSGAALRTNGKVDQYHDSLKLKLKELEQFQKAAVPEQAASQSEAVFPPKKKAFTSKSILESVQEPERIGPSPWKAEKVRVSNTRRNVLIIGSVSFLGLAVIAVVWAMFLHFLGNDEDYLAKLAMKTDIASEEIYQFPNDRVFDLKPIRLSGGSTSLSSVQETLERMTKPREVTNNSATTETTAEQPHPEGAVVAAPETQLPPQPELAVQASSESTASPSQPPSPEVPLLDPARLAQTTVESLGNAGGANRASVVRGPDGRLYGPPPSEREVNAGEARTIDGSPLRGYPVERFEPPMMFRTITSTPVLESPSLVAGPVARLDSNSKIQVVARIGQWLEILSTGGKLGYIYSQDAVADR